MGRLIWFLAASALWADPRCASCHPSIVESYLRTGKAKSVGKPRAEVQPQREWFHDFSGRRMGVGWQSPKLTHYMQIQRAVEAHEMSWAIGSGESAKQYIHRVSGSLFVSPISWYATRLIWDMAPGFVVDSNPNFYWPIARECLQCHAGRAAPVPGTLNRYQAEPLPDPAIHCDRCHGDPAAHLAAGRKGNIVNPATLSHSRRDAICEACHLSGEARAFNPGKQFADFQPGMEMESVFAIYVARKNADDTILPVQSQAEEMAASACAIRSEGKLWCGTCHDSHKQPAEKEKPAWYRDRCVKCHSSEPAETHRRRVGDDCVRCHMPRHRPYDGSHASRTDHWIRTRKSEQKFIDRGELLRAWREPPAELRNRNLALAYLANVERSRSLRRLREGLKHLDGAVREGHTDGAVALAAGMQYLRQQRPELALPWLQRAVEDSPADSLRRLQFAAGLLAAAKPDEARLQALEALKIEPLLEPAYNLLGQIEPNRAAHWKDEYRKLVPQRIWP